MLHYKPTFIKVKCLWPYFKYTTTHTLSSFATLNCIVVKKVENRHCTFSIIFYVAGLWGLLASPLFRHDGVFQTWSDKSLRMLTWNAVGAVTLIAWHGITATILFVG